MSDSEALLILIRIILGILAVVAVNYRLFKCLEAYDQKLIDDTKNLKPLVTKSNGIPTHAEEIKNPSDFFVYKTVHPKYYRSSSTKTYECVAEKCPNCGKYLPMLSYYQQITCPKCKLIIGSTKYSYERWVWR